jgi:hypothetical protein
VKLECCEPEAMPFPSGWARVHGRRCRRYRTGTKIGEEHVEAVRPSARTAGEHLAAWLRHPVGCSCASCSYVDAHVDDDDDRRGRSITDD